MALLTEQMRSVDEVVEGQVLRIRALTAVEAGRWARKALLILADAGQRLMAVKEVETVASERTQLLSRTCTGRSHRPRPVCWNWNDCETAEEAPKEGEGVHRATSRVTRPA